MCPQGNTKKICSLSATQFKAQPPQSPQHTGGFEFEQHLNGLKFGP